MVDWWIDLLKASEYLISIGLICSVLLFLPDAVTELSRWAESVSRVINVAYFSHLSGAWQLDYILTRAADSKVKFDADIFDVNRTKECYRKLKDALPNKFTDLIEDLKSIVKVCEMCFRNTCSFFTFEESVCKYKYLNKTTTKSYYWRDKYDYFLVFKEILIEFLRLRDGVSALRYGSHIRGADTTISEAYPSSDQLHPYHLWEVLQERHPLGYDHQYPGTCTEEWLHSSTAAICVSRSVRNYQVIWIINEYHNGSLTVVLSFMWKCGLI